MQRAITTLSSAFVMFFMAFAAQAATFNFENNDTDNNPFLSFSEDGVDLTVTGIGGNVSRAGNGLGVTGGTGQNRIGPGEGLLFEFNPSVTLIESIIFERGSGADTVVFLDSNNTAHLFSISGPGNSFQTLVNLGFLGPSFMILNPLNAGGDGFRIAEISVTPVPIPAALPLFAGALGLIGLLGWRRKLTTG